MSLSQAPNRIGNYSIIELIGEGATSNVYHAQHVKSLASVAIKQLRRQGLNLQEAIHRLLTERERSRVA